MFYRLEETFTQSKPTRAAIDQYVGQVHALEKHTSELHTKVSSLEAQLQSSRQEAVRWRALANDRLSAMEELRRRYVIISIFLSINVKFIIPIALFQFRGTAQK